MKAISRSAVGPRRRVPVAQLSGLKARAGCPLTSNRVVLTLRHEHATRHKRKRLPRDRCKPGRHVRASAQIIGPCKGDGHPRTRQGGSSRPLSVPLSGGTARRSRAPKAPRQRGFSISGPRQRAFHFGSATAGLFRVRRQRRPVARGRARPALPTGRACRCGRRPADRPAARTSLRA